MGFISRSVLGLTLLIQGGCAFKMVNQDQLRLDRIQKKEAEGRAIREVILARNVSIDMKERFSSEQKEGEAIKSYEAFLKRHKGTKPILRASALRRLADLKMKQARQHFIREMKAYDLNPNGPPPLIDYGEAITLYQEVLREHEDYTGNDEALYALARAYGESGDTEKALTLLKSLVTRYPDHAHRFESYFRLGEYYFDRRNYEKATVAYEVVASSGDPYFQDKALYKLAWSFFKLKDYPKSINLFLRMIDQTKGPSDNFSPEEGSLAWEALSYAANAFRQLGGPSVVATYFGEMGSRQYEREIYLSMANHYLVEKDLDKGLEAYLTFLRIHPQDPMAPFISSYIMEAYQRYGKNQEVNQARIALIENYDMDSTWYQSNSEDTRLSSRPMIQSTLHQIALLSHKKAQKEQEVEKKEAGFKTASTWYRRYLRNFPNVPEALEIQFLLGETLMAVRAYDEAGKLYEKVAYDQPEALPNRKAAYSAVVAYEQVSDVDRKVAFLKASRRFAKHFPNDPETPLVLFKAAESLYERHDYLAAAPIFESLLLKHPAHKTSAISRELLAHSYMKAGEYQKARSAYGTVLASLSETQSKKWDEYSGLLVSAIYKEAEAQKAAGASLKAAKLFEAISHEVPTHPLAPESLFEAALLYEGLQISKSAIRIYQKITRDYPKSKLVEQAHLHAGLLYESSGKLLQAADFFIASAELTSDLKQAEKLIWNAAAFYEKEDKPRKTFSTYLTFIQRFPNHAETPLALFKMANIRREEGRVKAANKLFQAVIDHGTKTAYYGQARLALAEQNFTTFKSLRITPPLTSSFKKLSRALKRVSGLYTLAIESRQVEIMAISSHRLGEIFEHFQSALLEAEAPPELDEDQLEEYHFQLEEKAYPFEEKAIKAYESNVSRVRHSAGFYDEWVKKSYTRLAELLPARYRRLERAELIVSTLDPELLVLAIQKERASDDFAKR